jgi:acyl carrier protein
MKSESQILESLRESVRDVLGKEIPISPDSRIKLDLHLDSIDTFGVLTRLEKKLGVKIDMVEFYERRFEAGLWGINEIKVRDLLQFIMTQED